MIAIKNMKIPDTCEDCDFCINKDDYNYHGECVLQEKHSNLVYYMSCRRDDDCPLTEIDASTMEEKLLKQLFPMGAIVIYNKQLFEKLEKIYIMENLIGTQLYKIVAEKRDNENIDRKRGRVNDF